MRGGGKKHLEMVDSVQTGGRKAMDEKKVVVPSVAGPGLSG